MPQTPGDFEFSLTNHAVPVSDHAWLRANYLSPQPIFFLALGARSPYRFGIASLSGDREAIEQGTRWLQGALTELGVGAKTGAGYGYWVLE